MFILFGTRGITLTQQSGTFQCPQCGPQAPFSQKGIRRFFTLFFVPVIPLNQVAAYVECHRCRGQFDVNVLQWNQNPTAAPMGMAPGIMPALQTPGMPPLPGRIPSLPNATITQRSNGMATASMVLGIVGLVTSFLLCPAFVMIPLSLIFGIIGLTQVGKTGTGKGKALAGIACSLLAVGVVTFIFIKSKDAADNAPPPTALEAAKKNVVSARTITSHGNTEEAKAMAESVAQKMQMMHDTMIVATKGNKTTDQYAVHCELHEKTCAFLIFVPDYRKFEDDLKNDMDELAWSVASGVAQSSGKLNAADAELCVGLKGLVMFGSIMTGGISDELPKKTSSNEKELTRFFPEKKSTPDAVPTEP
jgi:hypothetical protein